MVDTTGKPEPLAEPSGEAQPEARLSVRRKEPCPCGSGKKFKNCCIGDPRYELVEDTPPAAAAAPTGGSVPRAKTEKPFNQAPPKAMPPSRSSKSLHHRKV